MLSFWKIWHALFSCNTRFELCSFALLWTICEIPGRFPKVILGSSVLAFGKNYPALFVVLLIFSHSLRHANLLLVTFFETHGLLAFEVFEITIFFYGKQPNGFALPRMKVLQPLKFKL